MKDDYDDEFGKEAHDEGAPHHSGRDGHHCDDWDGLWICLDCCEYAFCRCGWDAPASKYGEGESDS